VALDLFESKGFAETTVDEIADHAVLSPSTFFRYFGTKEDVLFPGIAELLEVLRATLPAALAEHPPWEAVTHSVRITTGGFVEQNPALVARAVKLWMTEPSLRARYGEHAVSWERAIVEAVTTAEGTDPATDAYAAALAVAAVGAFRIAIEQFISVGGDLTDHFDAVLELMGHGLRTQRTPRR
jgi:AcrR family transcriptional regulator